MTAKRKWIGLAKAGIFILGFCFLFLEFQKVLHYRWEDLYSANIWIKTQPRDSYDVLYFGTSELKASVFPTAVFRYSGVTGFNCSVTNKSAATMYYQLKYALRYKDPKLVCCDFSALYDDNIPSEHETIYRKVVDTLPDRDLQWDMIRSIEKMEPEQSALSYLFPMLRYHSMWNELTEENFEEDYVFDEEYEEYENGSLLIRPENKDNFYDIMPEIWEAEPSGEPISASSAEWYDKFIALCHEKGITVAAVFTPALGTTHDKVARWETTKAYLDSRGVEIIDLNTYEAAQNMGFRPSEDLADDNTHMFYTGSLRTSLALSHILTERFGLPDHRMEEETAAEWGAYWEEFCKEYEVPEDFR